MESEILNAMKSAWGWIGIRPQKVYWINKFGNTILTDEGGCYWLMKPEELSCEIIAWTEDKMAKLWKSDDFILDWEMTTLVELAEGKFGESQSGRCFYFVISPVLGGDFELQNIQPISLLELIASSGDMALQIKDLPEGSQIRLIVTD